MELFWCSVSSCWKLLTLILYNFLFDRGWLKMLILNLLEGRIKLNPGSSMSLCSFIKYGISCVWFAQKCVIAFGINYYSSMSNVVRRDQHVLRHPLLLAYLWKVPVLLLYVYSIQIVLRVEELLVLGVRDQNFALRLLDPISLAIHLLSSLLHYCVSLLQLI